MVYDTVSPLGNRRERDERRGQCSGPEWSGKERNPESWLQSGSSQELVHHAARIKGYYYTPPPKSFPTIR